MAISVHPLTQAHAPAWDAFVLAHPGGTFFHRAGWAGVLESALGHRAHYAFTARDGVMTGVLPLGHMRSLFGNTLIAAPFCVYGGPLALDDASAAALRAHAIALMATTGAKLVEFRERGATAPGPGPGPGWVTRSDLYVTFRKPITADHDTNMKAIPRKQRAMVRKGIQNGLQASSERSIDPLYNVYAQSVRNLGTPVFGRKYFQALLDAFPDCSDVVTIRHHDTPVASVLNFYYRDEVLPYYGGGTAQARQLAANDFMYWSVMRNAVDRGCRLFDFGRSKLGTGAYDFKRNWGFTPEPLPYQYYLGPGATVPNLNPLNPKFRLFIAAWRRLPLPIANLLGPHIVRGLG